MRVNPVYFAVFFISKAASALWSQQDPSFKDVAGQDHPHLKREDFARYPKRLVHLKGKGRYFNGDSQYDSAKPIMYVPIGNKRRFAKTRRKMAPTTEAIEPTQLIQANEKSKINWNEIVQEINTMSRTTPKDHTNVKIIEDKDQSPAAYVVTITNPQGGKKNGEVGVKGNNEVVKVNPEGVKSNVEVVKTNSNHGLKSESKPMCGCAGPCSCQPKCPDAKCSCPPIVGPTDCPNSIENMFQCPKCMTHYIVRMNLRESKCCSQNGDKMLQKKSVNKKVEVTKPVARKTCNCQGPCACQPIVGPSDCPNSVETMFQCPKCKTHYIVRLNMRESKCCESAARSQPAPAPCASL
uniref:Laminin subunit alpha-5 n=1 Tax=Lygus hesperus TaxID=30085 RepID=A0A0A9XAY3_LYGHE